MADRQSNLNSAFQVDSTLEPRSYLLLQQEPAVTEIHILMSLEVKSQEVELPKQINFKQI